MRPAIRPRVILSPSSGENRCDSACIYRKPLFLSALNTESDIEKLRAKPCSGFFLVAAFWKPEDKQIWLDSLISELGLQSSDLVHDYCFRTISWKPDTVRDFALVGFRVK